MADKEKRIVILKGTGEVLLVADKIGRHTLPLAEIKEEKKLLLDDFSFYTKDDVYFIADTKEFLDKDQMNFQDIDYFVSINPQGYDSAQTDGLSQVWIPTHKARERVSIEDSKAIRRVEEVLKIKEEM